MYLICSSLLFLSADFQLFIEDKISNFSGHTEFLQKKYNCDDVLMLLTNNFLKIGVATTHVALKDVSNMITKDLIMSKLIKRMLDFWK